MSNKRFTEEFRIEAVKQVTERGYPVKEVSERLGVSTWSLYNWIKDYSTPPAVRQADQDQAARIKRLESELRRVTEERDILKKAAVSSTGQCNTICINHQEVLYGKDGTPRAVRSGEIRAMAQMAGRSEPHRHWFSPRQACGFGAWRDFLEGRHCAYRQNAFLETSDVA